MAYEEIVSHLAGIVGRANVLTSEEDRKVYSYDGTSTWVHKPESGLRKSGMPEGVL